MSLFRAFVGSSKGNVALTFGLAVLPLFAAGGVALDFLRQSTADTELQAVVDAAALAAANSKAATPAALKSKVLDYFSANNSPQLAAAITSVDVSKPDADTVKLTATAEIETTLMKVLGYNKLAIAASSEVTRSYGKLELALVLDNTDSMKGGKLATLKQASSDLLDEIYDPDTPSGSVKVAVVPFGQYVNIGMANRNASWMDVPPDSTSTTTECWDTYPDAVKSNCRMETSNSMVDGVSTPSTYEVCDWNYGTAVNQCGPVTRSSRWNGCVGSRNNPLDTLDADSSTRYPGIMDAGCPTEIAPLSLSKDAVLASIQAMSTSGDTYIPSGLLWGWNALSPAAPLAGGAPYADIPKGLKKAVVLMTDGLNSKSPTYPGHDGSDQALANSRTSALCANIKSSGIILYAVAFEVNDAATKTMLESCASDADKYFDAGNSMLLAEAFEDIGKSLAQLHVSK
jgi:Flp pilus assembly protein TadG